MQGRYASRAVGESPPVGKIRQRQNVYIPARGPHGDDAPELSVDDLDVHLLGEFWIRVGTRIIAESDWPLRRARNLLKFLALAPGHRSHREHLMDLLWPEHGQDAAANNLHKALHAARHVLEPHLPSKAPSRYLQLQGDLVVLRAPGILRIDVEEFQTAAELSRLSNKPGDYERALSLYPGDLLPQDAYEDWAILSRERLRHLRLEVLLGYAQVLEERGTTEDAVETLRQVLEIDRAHEEAHGRLMALLARSGHRQLALRQYLLLQSALEEELGAEPDPSIQQLFQDIRDNRLDIPRQADVPPVRVPAIKRSGDAARPQVIGRDQEIGELCRSLEALQEGTGGFVIVQGEAGTGKTHLITKLAEYAAQQGIVTVAGRSDSSESQRGYRQLAAAFAEYGRSSLLTAPPVYHAAKPGHVLKAISSSPLQLWESNLTSWGDASPELILIEFFKHVSTAAPALIVFDDLHLADSESLEFVRRLAQVVDDAPLLIIGTTRPPDDGVHSHILDTYGGAARKSLSVLSLHALGYSETVALVTQLLGAPADRSTLELIHSLSDGLPHFVRETALALVGRGGLQLVGGEWRLRPDGPQTVERRTLRQPSPELGTHLPFLVRDQLLHIKDTA